MSQLIQLQKKPNALSAALAPLWQSVAIEEKKHLSKQELLKYAQEAFDIDEQTHEKLMEEVKEEKVKSLRALCYGALQLSQRESSTRVSLGAKSYKSCSSSAF